MKYLTGQNQERRAGQIQSKDRIRSAIWATIVTIIVIIWRLID